MKLTTTQYNITWELKMKRLFILFVAAAFVWVGCSDESGIVNPEKPSKNYEWLTISKDHAGLGVENVVSNELYAEIDGNSGGKVKFDFNFQDLGGQDIQVKGKLKVKKNSYEGTLNLSMLFNDGDPSVFLSPSGLEFNKDLELTLKYKNLDLSGVNPGDEIQFAYIDASGQTVIAQYQQLKVKLNKGKLVVKKAKIPHFSRFGFVKVKD